MTNLTETPTTRASTILLSATSNDEYACTPEFCALTLTEAFVAKVRAARRLLMDNTALDLHAIELWDSEYSGAFFADDERAAVTAQQAGSLRNRFRDGQPYILLPDGFIVPERESGADWWNGGDGDIYCDTRIIVVTEWAFRLEYSPKHSDGTDFVSAEVSWETLDALFPE